MTLKIDSKALVIAGLAAVIVAYVLGHVPVLRVPSGCSTFIELTDPKSAEAYTLSMTCAKRPAVLFAWPMIDFETLTARQEAMLARERARIGAEQSAKEDIAAAEKRAAEMGPPRKTPAAPKPK